MWDHIGGSTISTEYIRLKLYRNLSQLRMNCLTQSSALRVIFSDCVNFAFQIVHRASRVAVAQTTTQSMH